MRTINVSTEVFAAIWSSRKEDEETEDDVLRRVFNCSDTQLATNPTQTTPGEIHIEQYDIHLHEGFEIFRRYKGKEFRARVANGRWCLENDGKKYPSLHKLSWAVVGGAENAWYAWKFLKGDGTEALIDALRDESQIQRRGG